MTCRSPVRVRYTAPIGALGVRVHASLRLATTGNIRGRLSAGRASKVVIRVKPAGAEPTDFRSGSIQKQIPATTGTAVATPATTTAVASFTKARRGCASSEFWEDIGARKH